MVIPGVGDGVQRQEIYMNAVKITRLIRLQSDLFGDHDASVALRFDMIAEVRAKACFTGIVEFTTGVDDFDNQIAIATIWVP